MTEQAAARIEGQIGVDDVLALLVRDEAGAPTPMAVHGELVTPADELVDESCAPLVVRPQTQGGYARCPALRPLRELAGPSGCLTGGNVGGNKVGTHRVPPWPVVSAPVT